MGDAVMSNALMTGGGAVATPVGKPAWALGIGGGGCASEESPKKQKKSHEGGDGNDKGDKGVLKDKWSRLLDELAAHCRRVLKIANF